jgi:hypothetical protein
MLPDAIGLLIAGVLVLEMQQTGAEIMVDGVTILTLPLKIAGHIIPALQHAMLFPDAIGMLTLITLNFVR